jgi:serine/threonine protein kinase
MLKLLLKSCCPYSTTRLSVDALIPDPPRNLNVRDLRILEKIDNGSVSTVYAALLNDRKVAVKRFEDKTKAQTEADILPKVQHEHVIRLITIVDEALYTDLVMEFMDNKDFSEYLFWHERKTIQDKEKCLKIALQIAKGLVYLHEIGVIHRDIKAENVLLNTGLAAKICDFNLSLQLKDGQTHAYHERSVGTPGWTSPEALIYDDKNKGYLVCPQTDTYGFGYILNLCVSRTGYNPFDDIDTRNPRDVRRADQRALTGRLPPIPADTPAPTTSLILHCWKYKPAERPSSAEVVEKMKKICAEL